MRDLLLAWRLLPIPQRLVFGLFVAVLWGMAWVVAWMATW